MDIKCSMCDKALPKGRRRFCSEACHYNYWLVKSKSDRIKVAAATRECPLCGKRYKDRRGSPRAMKYCSTTCRSRASRLRGYGLNTEDAKELMKDRQCNLCKRTMSVRQFHAEHDHVTNELYGLVCPRCNLVLRYIRRDPMIGFRIIEYLTIPPARMVGDGEPKMLTEERIKQVKVAENQTPRRRRSGRPY